MVDFILGIDWWLRALILAATLIIFAAKFFNEYMPAIVMAALTVLFTFWATSWTIHDPSKWSLFGDFWGLFWCHKFFIGGWATIYLICWLLFIILI